MKEDWWRRKVWIAALLLFAAVAGGVVIAADRRTDVHRVVLQINSDDPAPMKHAVSNSINLVTYFRKNHQAIRVAIVAYGRGIDMFRSHTSPVKLVLEYIHGQFPEISFVVCGNTEAIMEKQVGHPLSFIPGTRVVPSGIVQIVELEEDGWSYIRP